VEDGDMPTLKMLLREYEEKVPYALERMRELRQMTVDGNEKARLELRDARTLRRDYISSRIDTSTTGLLIRAPWFSLLEWRMMPLVFSELKTCREKGFISRDVVNNLFPEGELTVLFGDMGYLNLLNKGGNHARGDAMLKIAGNILHKSSHKNGSPIYWGRIGGDEFAAFSTNGLEVIDQVGKEITSAFSRQSVSLLEEYYLKPRIDFGVTTLNEAWSLLWEYFERYQEIDRVPFNVLTDIFVGLADTRSSLEKCFGHIDFQVSLIEDSFRESKKYPCKLYERVHPYLAKSALELEYKHLLELMYLKGEDGYRKEILTLFEGYSKTKDPLQTLILQAALDPYYLALGKGKDEARVQVA
jgi:GGDEF domain-containing protein